MPKSKTRRYALLADPPLEQLANDGDLNALTVKDDRRIVREYASDPHSSYCQHYVRLGEGVNLLFKKIGKNHPVSMFVEITSTVSVEQIKQAWAEIGQWRKFLREWQGPGRHAAEGYIASLANAHRKGYSYQDLVNRVAAEALYWLQWYTQHSLIKDDVNEALGRIEQWTE